MIYMSVSGLKSGCICSALYTTACCGQLDNACDTPLPTRGHIAGMLGYVELLEHLQVMMYLYYVFSILQLTTVGLLMVRFWRKW